MQSPRCVRGARGLAEALGVSLSTAEGLLRRGEVKALRIGRCVLVELAEIDRFLEKLRTEQQGDPR